MRLTDPVQRATNRPVHGQASATRDAVVKSAGRVLRILELFDRLRAPANAQTVASALGFPASSASALLRSMVASGYLHFDTRRRTYAPTLRVPLLGSGWVAPRLYGGSPLEQIMERLRERCAATVMLVARNGDVVEDILVLTADGSPALPGEGRRLTSPGAGWLLLSALGDQDARLLLHRLNAEASRRGDAILPAAGLLPELARIRAEGHAVGADPLAGEAGLVAVPLPLQEAGGPFALVLSVAREDAMQRGAALAQIMRQEIARHIGVPKPVLRWPDAPLPPHGVMHRAGAATVHQATHAPA